MFLSELRGPRDNFFYVSVLSHFVHVDHCCFIDILPFCLSVCHDDIMTCPRSKKPADFLSLLSLSSLLFLKMLDRVSRLSLSECVIWTIYCVRTALASLTLQDKKYVKTQYILIIVRVQLYQNCQVSNQLHHNHNIYIYIGCLDDMLGTQDHRELVNILCLSCSDIHFTAVCSLSLQ